MRSWPYEPASALGFAMFENFTSAQATIIDQNAAAAASGDIWSDIAIIRNMFPIESDGQLDSSGGTLFGQALVWEPTLRRWWNFGSTSGSVATACASYDGGDWFNCSLAGDVPTANSSVVKSAVTNGLGIILAGIAPTGATDLKIRRSANAGVSWTGPTSAASNSGAINALCWMPSASLFVAAMGNTLATNIETSPDGVTWTARTAPNTNARHGAAANAVRAVIISSASTNKCITSEDGITWTERTLPATSVWRAVVWNPDRGLFMAISDGGHAATSPDGITWTQVSSSAPNGSEAKLCALYRMWIIAGPTNNLYVSVDDGANFTLINNFTMTSGFSFATSDCQALFAYQATTKRSIKGGL